MYGGKVWRKKIWQIFSILRPELRYLALFECKCLKQATAMWLTHQKHALCSMKGE